jgi:hypothetical protein
MGRWGDGVLGGFLKILRIDFSQGILSREILNLS